MVEIKNGVEGKVCRKCNVWKPRKEYYNSWWKHSVCGKCHKEHYSKTQRNNPNNCCTKCKRRRGDFRDYGGYLDEDFGRHWGYCKMCMHVVDQERKDTPRRKEIMFKSAEKRRKSESEAGFIDYYESKLLKHVYGDLCLYSNNPNGPICGMSCKSHSDHVIPLSKNGMHYAYNRQPLCKSHNSSKGNHNNIDYRPDKGLLAQSIHNLRIGQCNDRKDKKRYYEWIVAQIEINGAQILHTLPNIFDWLEPLELAA